YTPSGRLIQTPYEDGDRQSYFEQKFENYEETYDPRSYQEHIPDSLKVSTAHERLVFGGGGILPDVVIAPDSTEVLRAVLYGGVLDNPAVLWFQRHEQAMRDQWGDR